VTCLDTFFHSGSLPVSVQVMGINTMAQLKQDITLARAFQADDTPEKSELLARVKDVAGDGRHELFKSTKVFDGPHHRKQHPFDLQTA
jgi:hypothetical protein